MLIQDKVETNISLKIIDLFRVVFISWVEGESIKSRNVGGETSSFWQCAETKHFSASDSL